VDQRLRRRERSGSADSPDAIRARLRAGALTPQRVALAGYLGHEGAALALAPPRAPRGVEPWLAALREDRNAQLILTALEQAEEHRLRRPALKAEVAAGIGREAGGWHGNSTSLDRALARLDEEGLLSSQQGGAALRATPAGLAWLRANRVVGEREASQRVWHALLREALPRWQTRDPGNWRYRKNVETLEDYLVDPTPARLEGWGFWAQRSLGPIVALRELLAEEGEAFVRELITRDVAGWALGRCDPVREHLAARQAEDRGA